MNIEMKQGERLIKEGAANLQRNIETVGGKLYLTNQRLLFEAHKANVQRETTEIGLSDIHSTKKCWTKFLGFIPVMPNSLSVYTSQGNEYQFVLFGRAEWAKEIVGQKNA